MIKMYKYEDNKNRIFTDEEQREFLKVRDEVNRLLDISGSFMLQNVFKEIYVGDTDMWLAYIDRLVELGEIKEIKRDCMSQHKIFVKKN
jgi:hypothetical protein